MSAKDWTKIYHRAKWEKRRAINGGWSTYICQRCGYETAGFTALEAHADHALHVVETTQSHSDAALAKLAGGAE